MGSPGTNELTAFAGTSLSHASATLHTARGDVSFSWSWEADRLDVDLTVPVGMQALLYMPYGAGLPYLDGQPVSQVEDVEAVEVVTLHGASFNGMRLSSGHYKLSASKIVLVV